MELEHEEQLQIVYMCMNIKDLRQCKNEETRQRENETKEHSVRDYKFISTGTEIHLVS